MENSPKADSKEVQGVSMAKDIFSLALYLSMLVVGVLYRGEEHCKLEVSKYIYDEFHFGDLAISRLKIP